MYSVYTLSLSLSLFCLLDLLYVYFCFLFRSRFKRFIKFLTLIVVLATHRRTFYYLETLRLSKLSWFFLLRSCCYYYFYLVRGRTRTS